MIESYKTNKYDGVKSVISKTWEVQTAIPLDYSFKEMIELSGKKKKKKSKKKSSFFLNEWIN